MQYCYFCNGFNILRFSTENNKPIVKNKFPKASVQTKTKVISMVSSPQKTEDRTELYKGILSRKME